MLNFETKKYPIDFSKKHKEINRNKMDHSPCNNLAEERNEKNLNCIKKNKNLKGIKLMNFIEKNFDFDNFSDIQNNLHILNIVEFFSFKFEKNNSSFDYLQENNLFQNICNNILNEEIKKILKKVIFEYENIIVVEKNTKEEFSFEEKRNFQERIFLKKKQEDKIENEISILTILLNNLELKKDNNFEILLNDIYLIIEMFMYILNSYFIFFRKKIDFEYSEQLVEINNELKINSEKKDNLNLQSKIKKNSENLIFEDFRRHFKDDKSKYSINNYQNSGKRKNKNKNFSQIINHFQDDSFNIINNIQIFDNSNNENPEKKKIDGSLSNKNKDLNIIDSGDKFLLISPFEENQIKSLNNKQGKFEKNLKFLFFIFNLFEDKNFSNLFNFLIFMLDKIKIKNFYHYYSLVNNKYLNSIFASGKKTIKHIDNLILFSIFSKKIFSENFFQIIRISLKITDIQINKFFFNSGLFDRVIFEYMLLNFKDEKNTFLEKYSSLNGGLENQVLFFCNYLDFWNKEKFYNVHQNIDYNTIFLSCNEALIQMLTIFRLKIIEFLEELIKFFSNTQNIMKTNNCFNNLLSYINPLILKSIVNNIRQFICNHVYSIFINDNIFELINRSIWMKPIIEVYSLCNFSSHLFDIFNFMNSTDKTMSYTNPLSGLGDLSKKSIEMEFITNLTKGKTTFKFLSTIFKNQFIKVMTLIPKRIVFLREVSILNFLFLFSNFIEKNTNYLYFLRENPEKEIIMALEKFAKFQNKYLFILSNYILRLLIPERKHRLRIYSLHNFPLDFLEIEESESLKKKISEILFKETYLDLVIKKNHNFISENNDNAITNPNKGFEFENINSFKNNLNLYDFKFCKTVNETCDNNNKDMKNFFGKEERINFNDDKDSRINNSSIINFNKNLKVNNEINYPVINQPNLSNLNLNKKNDSYEIIRNFKEKDNILYKENCEEKKKNLEFNNSSLNLPIFENIKLIPNDNNLIESIDCQTNKSSSLNKKNKEKQPDNKKKEKFLNNKIKNKELKQTAHIKHKENFNSKIFFDFSSIITNFQYDHLKILEKNSSKKFKINYLNKYEKILNFTFHHMELFDNCFNNSEKIFIKVSNIRSCFVLVQKEDGLLFFDDSEISNLKSYFNIDMINKADLEYFLLMNEENFKDNNLMLMNFLNNFYNCDLKNNLSWVEVIDNICKFLY